jgi:hypothetical protein
LARLRAPALGVSVELGEVDEYETPANCNVQRFEEPRGLGYSCSAMGTSLAAVYQVGAAIYYRSNDPRLHAIRIPCNAVADFDVRGFEPMHSAL